MAYEKKNGDTVLFRQDDKKNDKSPDFKGEMLWNGETIEIALWTKNGSQGEFWAGSAKVRGAKYDKPVADQSRTTNPSFDDSSIPF